MRTPDVPLRLEFEIEVPGTPEQVWDALATADGLSAWFLPTESDERLGGRQLTHMGPEDMPADIVGWEPPYRFAYSEDISGVPGAEPGAITPVVSEFLVEARSGGTCVVRVVSSAFGVGAAWEQEFFEDMRHGWLPYFEQLRVYLSHFPGQRATTFSVSHEVPGSTAAVLTALHAGLGGARPGDRIDVAGTTGTIDRIEPVLLIRLDAPVPGMLRIATGGPFGQASTEVGGYLFPPAGTDAAGLVRKQQDLWMSFLQDLTAGVPQ